MKQFILFLILISQAALAESEISDFQWKNRLLIIPEATEALVKELGSEKAGLADRDMRVFILGGKGASEYPANPKLAAEFTKRLSPDSKNPKIFLIGKDGRTTLSWKKDEFSFKKLYASIDAMPMRRREIRESGS